MSEREPLYTDGMIDGIVDTNIFHDSGTSTYRVWEDRAVKYLRLMRDAYEARIAELEAKLRREVEYCRNHADHTIVGDLLTRIDELEANQWIPVEDNEYDTGDDFNPLYIFGNTNYDVCTNVEYANESVTLDMGMAVCRRKG
jgi:hypothetical protein